MKYLVTLSESELKLFSEFQKEFARRDYLHLNQEGAEKLNQERNKLAKELWEKRKSTQKFDAPDARNSNYGFHLNETRQKADTARNTIFNDINNQSTKLVSSGDTNSFTTRIKRQTKNNTNLVNKLGTKGKIGLGIAGVTAGVAGLGYGIHKLKNKKNNSKDI